MTMSIHLLYEDQHLCMQNSSQFSVLVFMECNRKHSSSTLDNGMLLGTVHGAALFH